MQTLQSFLIFFAPLLAVTIFSIPFIPIILRKVEIETIGFWFFLPLLMPQFIDDFTRVRWTSFESGDSKSSMIAITSLLTPCILLEVLALKSNIAKRNKIRLKAMQLIFTISFFGLSLLSVYSGLVNPRPFVPTFGALSFLYLIAFLYRYEIDVKKFLNGTFKFGFLISCATFTLTIIQFPWLSRSTQSIDIDFTEYLSSTYISPFNKFLDIPLREGFFFNDGAQAAAVFFGTLFTTMLSCKDIKYRNFYLIFPFLNGSFTGSRTFYLMCAIGLVFNFARAFNKSNIMFYPIFRILIFVSVYYLATTLASSLVKNSQNIQSFSGRTQIWTLVLDYWDESGLMGHGMNTLKAYVATLHWDFAFEHAHNSILQWLWDFGIFGSILATICHLIALTYWAPMSVNGAISNSRYSIISLSLLVAFTEVTLTLNANSILGLGWLLILLMILNSPTIEDSNTYTGAKLNQ